MDGIPPAHGVLVAVPDHAIGSCAAELGERFERVPAVVLHTSGLHEKDVLEPLRALGCRLGSLHPLMTFASASGPLVDLRGVMAAVEGDLEAVREARSLARRLGLRAVVLPPGAKARYHAAAAIAANLTHVLAAEAREQLVHAGLTRRQATAALGPLLQTTLANVLTARGLEKLTGPVVRGDGATLTAHLAALPVEVAAVYRAVTALAVSRLEAAELLSAQAAQALDRALTSPGHCDSVTAMRLSEGA